MPRKLKKPENLHELPIYLRNVWFILELKNMNPAVLARRMGLKYPIVWRWLNEKREGKGLYAKDLLKMAEALEVDPIVLFVPRMEDQEIFNEMLKMAAWILNQPSEARRTILRFGILSYKMYQEEIYGEVIDTPEVRIVKR